MDAGVVESVERQIVIEEETAGEVVVVERVVNVVVEERAVPFGAHAKGFVFHGDDAATPRPSGYGSIEWIGSASPLNGAEGDTWVIASG